MKISPRNEIYRSDTPEISNKNESQEHQSVIENTKILNTVCADIRYKSQTNPEFGTQELAKDHCWGKIYSNVDQALLKDAHHKMTAFSSLCHDYDIKIIPRREKSKTRVDQKNEIAHRQENISRAGHIDQFRVVNDFMAARIHCEIPDIQPTVDKFKKMANDHNGWCVVRGTGKDSYGAHHKNGEFKDIVQYLFIYLPEMGHVTELQVGHEFTSITFTIDSFIRDNADKKEKHELPVSLWGDKTKGTNLYDTIKNYLVLKANDPQNINLPKMKKECHEVAQRLFSTSSIPQDIQAIINNL